MYRMLSISCFAPPPPSNGGMACKLWICRGPEPVVVKPSLGRLVSCSAPDRAARDGRRGSPVQGRSAQGAWSWQSVSSIEQRHIHRSAAPPSRSEPGSLLIVSDLTCMHLLWDSLKPNNWSLNHYQWISHGMHAHCSLNPIACGSGGGEIDSDPGAFFLLPLLNSLAYLQIWSFWLCSELIFASWAKICAKSVQRGAVPGLWKWR